MKLVIVQMILVYGILAVFAIIARLLVQEGSASIWRAQTYNMSPVKALEILIRFEWVCLFVYTTLLFSVWMRWFTLPVTTSYTVYWLWRMTVHTRGLKTFKALHREALVQEVMDS